MKFETIEQLSGACYNIIQTAKIEEMLNFKAEDNVINALLFNPDLTQDNFLADFIKSISDWFTYMIKMQMIENYEIAAMIRDVIQIEKQNYLELYELRFGLKDIKMIEVKLTELINNLNGVAAKF